MEAVGCFHFWLDDLLSSARDLIQLICITVTVEPDIVYEIAVGDTSILAHLGCLSVAIYARWFAVIGAFRSSLLFRLTDDVPSKVRFVVERLLCFLIVGISFFFFFCRGH